MTLQEVRNTVHKLYKEGKVKEQTALAYSRALEEHFDELAYSTATEMEVLSDVETFEMFAIATDYLKEG